ncbi:LOW QUALITY PROTEIN: serine proteinase stubble-like [Homalodisca vitripennis]|nr:LOW QUALITY PROTEIN: serine proteinase stubble-like [Homalodisca vitripennis]
MILLWVQLILLVAPSLAALHPSSLCPSVFSYEGSQPEHERWYGIILLSTDESLVGVRIDIRLDRPAELLVSWMGTVTSDDNEHFTILSLDQKLHPGPPLASRFMVKFNAVKGSPQVQNIRLNGRQICPPDPNFATDIQHNGQDHLFENRYTTERITRRPDLDFDDDWANSRPATPGTYKPERPVGNNGYNNGYNSHESGSGGYNSQGSDGSGSRNPVRTTTYATYDSHETYHGNGNGNHRPSGSALSTSNTHSVSSRPSSGNRGQPSSQSGVPRPLVTENTQYTGGMRPSISININKDVTYNVDRPDPNGYMNNNPSGGGQSRPSSEREPSYTPNQHPKTTERYNNEFTVKTTTKKTRSSSQHQHKYKQRRGNNPSGNGNFNPSKTTTRRPYTNQNNGTGNNNQRTTTRRPTSSNSQRPNSNNGYQSNRPNRNPDIASSETHYQSGYGQNSYENNEKTTERNHYNNDHGNNNQQSNQRPWSTEVSDNSRPSAVPSSRPSGGGGHKKVPRPQMNSGSNHGGTVENSRVRCGQVEVNPTPLITHGQNTARGQWPWHIALYRIEGINLSYSCGGSLVSSTVVITAAHCVTKAPRDRPVDADILVVQLGKYHLYQFSDDSVQNKQVRDVHVHPRYNSTNYLDDLAVLVLSSPAEFTKFVRPVCLWPKNNFNLPSIDNMEGTVVGWGYDENNQVTEELKMARMPVVSYVTCLKSYPQFFSQFTSENKTFCAGFRQGTSVCNGDSGGGMVFQQNNVWYLRGLVSITVAKQGLRVCDTNHYVVFTDVANYINWISQYLS